MAEKHNANSRYIYLHETDKLPAQAVDIHHLVTRKNHRWTVVASFSAFVFLLNVFYLMLKQDILVSVLLLYLITGVAFLKLLRQKIVEKECVVIIPAFGVQLETHYRRYVSLITEYV
ncbi:hypothetical protein BVRB_6g135710 [Beta vulgaris subsp. vulgaris]|nr:hypothetical protein BVRB_6g135710 [Beta vulgaris subsp. vulgaris]